MRQTVDVLLNERSTTEDVPIERLREQYSRFLYELALVHNGRREALRMLNRPWPRGLRPKKDHQQHILTAAAHLGYTKYVKTLLDDDVSPNHASDIFGLPLAAAAAEGHFALVRLLLDHGANPEDGTAPTCYVKVHEAKTRSGLGSAIQAAARSGHLATVNFLLSHPCRSPWNSLRDFRLAVLAASRGGHEKIVETLLDTVPEEERPPLWNDVLLESSSHCQTQLVLKSLASGANPNFCDVLEGIRCSPMAAAASSGYASIISLLRKHGAQLFKPVQDDLLELAGRGGFLPVVRALSPSFLLEEENSGVIQEAQVAAAENGHVAFISGLLSLGAEPLQAAMEVAAGAGQDSVIRLLAGNGVAVDEDATDGARRARYHPLLVAKIGGHQHSVRLLLDLGAEDVNPMETCHAGFFKGGVYSVKSAIECCA